MAEDNVGDVSIGELARRLERMEGKLDRSLAAQGKMRTEIAVIKVKVAFQSMAISAAAVGAFEIAKMLLS